MRPDVTRWLDRRTSRAADWPLADLLAAKGATRGQRRPARARRGADGRPPSSRAIVRDLVDDRARRSSTRSSSWTPGAATARLRWRARAGAPRRAPRRRAARDPVGARQGRGAVALAGRHHRRRRWSSSTPTWRTSPSGPSSGAGRPAAPTTRPSRWSRASTTGRCATASSLLANGGGRVTELVARPLLNLHWPELAGVVQPLGGEYAARRSLLEQLPFPTGYGVELALLVDTLGLARPRRARPGRPRRAPAPPPGRQGARAGWPPRSGRRPCAGSTRRAARSAPTGSAPRSPSSSGSTAPTRPRATTSRSTERPPMALLLAELGPPRLLTHGAQGAGPAGGQRDQPVDAARDHGGARRRCPPDAGARRLGPRARLPARLPEGRRVHDGQRHPHQARGRLPARPTAPAPPRVTALRPVGLLGRSALPRRPTSSRSAGPTCAPAHRRSATSSNAGPGWSTAATCRDRRAEPISPRGPRSAPRGRPPRPPGRRRRGRPPPRRPAPRRSCSPP